MNLRQRVGGFHAVAALLSTHDADAVVDLVVFRPPSRTEANGGLADLDRAQTGYVAFLLGMYLSDDRRGRECGLGRGGSLRGEPTLLRL
jgi:hypothetical protein